MRKLEIDKAALKELEGFPPKQYRQVVSAIFELLSDPAPHYSKALIGSPYRRIAVGEYRVVYQSDDAVVRIFVVGKRNDDVIYKEMKRRM